jgi:DNA-binding SARP family transcriptional activator/tetratricopeptide (TPR) repeat protein
MVGDGASRVEFRLLGPVEMWVGGRNVDAGRPHQRAVLAALLVDAGQVVPVETLIDRVWGQVAPEQVRTSLRAHVSRIRRLLEQAEERGAAAATLSRVSGGYSLRIDPGRIDLHRFRQLVGAAADGGTDNAVESLRTALALWRGRPLAGVESEWAGRVRELWGRERVDAAVAWARAELARANPRPVLAGLAELASDNPLVESLTEMLMRALHAAGRTSEAVDLYARTRAHLAEELGTDPGPELQALHRSLLRGEVETVPAAGPARDVPRQLPVPPQLFTGRMIELAELDKIHDASTVVITAIDGMAGVGKTALAVQSAHQMVDRYPDGQLFLDLHGYTEGVVPIEPDAALDRMLRSLGVPGERIPVELDERAALFRTKLADQRMIIVLDNATSEAQVRPLLPGAPGCVVLVTSRRRLAGLDHTHTLSLDTLPLVDAVALLRNTAGDDRLAGQPPALVEELVELCGRLPLAIRIAAARLRSHPAWDLTHLVRRLRDQDHRLAELQAGQRSVDAALDLSYQDLSVDQQRAYRRLGLHPGPDLDPYAAAALLDATLPATGQVLEQLLEAHLLQEPTPGRYRFHDLTRAHAASTAARDEHRGPVALDRLLDHYRYTAAAAMDAAYPYERAHRPQVPPAGTPGPALLDETAALDWLDSELPNLIATTRYAAEHDRPAHLLHLSSILHRQLRTRGRYDDAETLHQNALTAARAAGDHGAEMEALTGLGQIHRVQGRYEQATDQFAQALQLAANTSQPAAELDALNGLGHIHRMQGRFEQATDLYQQATELARAIDDLAGEMDAVVGLANMYRVQGRYEPATDRYERVLQLARTIGHRNAEQIALLGLGQIHRIQGRYEQATDNFQQALQLVRVSGDRTIEQAALLGLGDVRRVQGRYERAADDYQLLLDLAHESGGLNWQFEAWQGLGRVHHSTGRSDTALTDHDHALALAIELDQPDDQARAHDGLAHAHRALHQPDLARTHWHRALDLLSSFGLDHADDEETTVVAIGAHLANLEADTEEAEPPSSSPVPP